MFLGNYSISTFVYSLWFPFFFFFSLQGSAGGLFISLLQQENMEIQTKSQQKNSEDDCAIIQGLERTSRVQTEYSLYFERILSCLLQYL